MSGQSKLSNLYSSNKKVKSNKSELFLYDCTESCSTAFTGVKTSKSDKKLKLISSEHFVSHFDPNSDKTETTLHRKLKNLLSSLDGVTVNSHKRHFEEKVSQLFVSPIKLGDI